MVYNRTTDGGGEVGIAGNILRERDGVLFAGYGEGGREAGYGPAIGNFVHVLGEHGLPSGREATYHGRALCSMMLLGYDGRFLDMRPLSPAREKQADVVV